jgi:uncharacterized protein YjaG (DUF416 family)
MVFRFDRTELLASLERLGRWQLTLFSAASTEFLVPAYRLFSEVEGVGDPQRVEAVLERVWGLLTLGVEDFDAGELPDGEEILDLVPDQDEDWNEWSLCGEYAIASLAALVRVSATGEAAAAAEIAQYCYEAADSIIAKEIDPPFMTADVREQILGSEFVQAELRRQQECVTALADLAEPSVQLAERLRNDAREQAARFFH